MMKYTSKLAYLLGLPVLVGVSILSVINVVNGGVSISVPVIEDLHKPILRSLYLSWGENQTYILLDQGNNRFHIKNGLVMGQDSQLSLGASFVAIGGGKKNKISTKGTQSNNSSNVSNSGIGGGLSNIIATESSVIGGGKDNVTFCNNCSSEQVNAVAGGYNNYAGDGGVIIGGSSNKIWGSGSSAAPGVIVGGQNNKLGGNGIVLGHGARGGNGSFSWNNPQPTGNSAAIWASSGVLVGTTDPITGINLVVNGAIKISTGEGNGLVGEIRMMSGCFYGYDGQSWYVINKNGSDDCPRTVCVFGSTLLQPGNLVDAYEEPYSANCISGKIMCHDDGILGDAGKNYYPYCYDLGEPSCGDAVNQEYVWEPTVNLCLYGDPYGMTGSDTEYTWTCKHKDSPISCSATRKYDCGPNEPTGIGVKMGSGYYYFGDKPENTGWTYMDKSKNLGICQWACAEGYEKVDGRNECKEIGSHSCIYSGDSLIVGNDNYFRNINQAWGSGQIAKLYRTEAEAIKNPCSYVCRQESGRQPVGLDNIHCAMCESGTEIRDQDNTYIKSCQEIRNICKTRYRYLQDTNLCTKLGVCFSSAGLPANPPEGADLGQYEQPYQYLPLGVNLRWTYVNSTGDIQPNRCQYTCKPAHTHEGSTCKPPSCPGNLPNGQSTGGYVTHENPVVSNPSRELIDFEYRYQFEAYVENKTGCYYWCPERFKCNGKCYKDQIGAAEACAGVSTDDPIITPGNTNYNPGNETTYSCPDGWRGPFTGDDGVTQICKKYLSSYATTGYCGLTCNDCQYSGSGVVEAGGITYYYYDCRLGYMEVNANPQTDPTCQDGDYRDSDSNQCVCVNCIRISSCSTGRVLEGNNCRQLQCRGNTRFPGNLRGLFGSSGTVNRDGINYDLYYEERIFTGANAKSECYASGCCLYCSENSIGSTTYDGKTVCLKKCDPNQYFNPLGRGNTCTSCANVELEPDPDRSNWLYVDGHDGQEEYGTPISCVNKCPDDELMWEPVNDNSRGHCVPISQEATQCPEGYTQSSIVGQQIECSRPPTVVQW